MLLGFEPLVLAEGNWETIPNLFLWMEAEINSVLAVSRTIQKLAQATGCMNLFVHRLLGEEGWKVSFDWGRGV